MQAHVEGRSGSGLERPEPGSATRDLAASNRGRQTLQGVLRSYRELGGLQLILEHC